MAKLVEILAKELGEWPDGVSGIWQSEHDHELYFDGPTRNKYPDWLCDDRGFYGRVTREMWQAERDRAVTGQGVKYTEMDLSGRWRKSLDGDPRTMRDRIREIDATIEAMTAERAELVSKLAGEGFALIVQAAEPVEDMSDWRNWKVGDLVESLGDSGGYSLGNTYTIKGFDYDRGVVHTEADERGSKTNGWRHYMFKFHSRPTS